MLRTLMKNRLFWIISISVGVHLLLFLIWPGSKSERSSRLGPYAGPHELLPAEVPEPLTAKTIAPSKRELSQCDDRYADLFKKETLRIHIVFGYKDARPARFVGDRYEKNMFLQYLLGDCPPEFHACGFRRDVEDADHFIRKIEGPDGRPKTVHLYVGHSSVGPDDEENRGRSFQNWQSGYAKRLHEDGFAEADIVFYNGHSREGGGPDFAPPRLLGGHVDYPWYKKHRPGFKRMIASLERATPQVYGLFSCESTPHFAGKVRSTAQTMALITSRNLLYYTDALRNMLGALSGMLGMYCERDLGVLLQKGTPRLRSRLTGFFPKN